MLRKLNEKFRAKYPVATLSYSMVKVAHLDNAFSEIFELEASQVEGQSLQRNHEIKNKKERQKKKFKNLKSLKMWVTFSSQNLCASLA